MLSVNCTGTQINTIWEIYIHMKVCYQMKYLQLYYQKCIVIVIVPAVITKLTRMCELYAKASEFIAHWWWQRRLVAGASVKLYVGT